MERCQECGELYEFVWWVPDQIWQRVTGKPNGLFCIDCFDKLARGQGIYLYWACREGEYPDLDELGERIAKMAERMLAG